jgi:purine-binding chemotaxis protein CheW
VRSIKFPASGWNFMLNINDILGMAKMKGGVKILLDMDRVLSAEEKDTLEKTV